MRVGSLRGLARERARSVAALGAVLSAVLLAASASAGAGRIGLRIEPPALLQTGDHASIAVHVTVAEDGAVPVVLTPSIEGTAVELARGRLSRADARRAADGSLRFEVPVIARGEGTAILRVELASYECKPRCKQVVETASQPLRVAAR